MKSLFIYFSFLVLPLIAHKHSSKIDPIEQETLFLTATEYKQGIDVLSARSPQGEKSIDEVIEYMLLELFENSSTKIPLPSGKSTDLFVYLEDIRSGKIIVRYLPLSADSKNIRVHNEDWGVSKFEKTINNQAIDEYIYLKRSNRRITSIKSQLVVKQAADVIKDGNTYNQHIRKADEAFRLKNYEEAYSTYSTAFRYTTDTLYVSERVRQCRSKLADYYRKEGEQSLANSHFAIAKQHFKDVKRYTDNIREINSRIATCDTKILELQRDLVPNIKRAKQLYKTKNYYESYQLFMRQIEGGNDLDADSYYLLGRMLYYNYQNLRKKANLEKKKAIELGEFYITIAAKNDFIDKKYDSDAINLFYQMLR